MPFGYPIQTNFTAGEISPSLYGRVDINKYFNAAARIENFIALPEGGLLRSSGTRYIAEVENSDELNILVDFEYSTVQAYTLIFGDQTIRILKDEGVVESGGSPVEVATPYLEAELRELKFAQSADVLYIAHKNHAPRVLTRSSDTSWTLSELDFRDGPYLDEDTSDTELRLTSITNRGTLKSTVNDFVVGDVGKFVEFVYNGQTLIGEIKTFVSATEVTIEPKDNVVDPKTIDPKAVLTYATSSGGLPYRIQSTTAIWSAEVENSYIKVGGNWFFLLNHLAEKEEIPEVTGPPKEPAYSVDLMQLGTTPTMVSTTGILVFSDQSITATLKASKATFDSSRDVGRHVRLNLDSEQIWCEITSYTSTTEVDVSLGRMVPLDPKDPSSFVSDAKTTKWKFGAWYVDNYPSVVTFHEGRLNYFNTPSQPQTHWTTTSAGYGSDFAIFSPTDDQSQVLDDSGINRTLDSGKVNSIYWAVTGPVLLIGTSGAEWQIKPDALNQALTPGNYNSKEQTAWGSENISAKHVGSSVLFIQRGGRILREMQYSFEIDAHVSMFLSILSNHIFKEQGGVVDMAVQRAPYTRVWLVTGSGQLVTLTFEKEQEVVAFTRQLIGGSFGTGTGNAVVEAVETSPRSDGEDDVVYVIVKRTINGDTKRYVEYIEKDFWPTSSVTKDDMFFVDSGLSFDLGDDIAFTSIDVEYAFTPPYFSHYPFRFKINFNSAHGLSDGELIRITGGGLNFLKGEVFAVEYIDSTSIYLLPKEKEDTSGPYGDADRYIYYVEIATGTPIDGNYPTDGTVAYVSDNFSNLDHLEGETVQVFLDGSYINDLTVTSGEVNLPDTYANKASIGLSYTSLLKTLPIEAGSVSGTAQGKIKRIHELVVRLLHSIGFEHGIDENNLTQVSFRKSNDAMNESPSLFSGDKTVKLDSDYDTLSQYFIAQSLPYNLHITSLMPKVRTTK